ncbi:MAG: ribonuclease III [Deltaproteobacteria bacterium]
MTGVLLDELQSVIGYRFRQPDLLLEALTHSSYVQESTCKGRDNERLEFLGDAILSFLVSVRLAESFPEIEEGELSRARARLVTAAYLAEMAGRIDLGKYLQLGRGEEKTGGREKAALRADALEAVVAALYRDGGLEAAEAFVDRFILPPDLKAGAETLFTTDYKSALQERLQAARRGPAEYRVIEEKGPEHRKTFVVEVTANNGHRALGRGSSKKAAEQRAAESLLSMLEGGPKARE